MNGTGVAAAAATALILLAVACGGDPPPERPVTRADPIVPVDSGIVVIETDTDTLRANAEIAETDEQKRTGLMERTSLGEMEGMIFLYDTDRAPDDPFYMFRTRIPLDIAFMDSAGQVVAILQMEPCTHDDPRWCERYAPGVAYRSALEMRLGFFESLGVGLGDRIQLVERFEP